MFTGKDFLRTVGWYVVLVIGGIAAVLMSSILVGYLPYSDRPGPGWYGKGGSLPLEVVKFILAWALFLLPPLLVVGSGLWVFTRAVELLPVPTYSVRIAGSTTAALASGFVVLAMGWYIALDEWPVYSAMALGGVWGAWLLPRPRGRPGRNATEGRELSCEQQPAWLRFGIGGSKAVAFSLLGLMPSSCFLFAVMGVRPPVRWEIPYGYRGWVQIQYERPLCPALRHDDIHLVIPITSTGCACTSSTRYGGLRTHQYVYVSADGKRSQLDRESHIHGLKLGAQLASGDWKVELDEFFVGTEAEFSRAESVVERAERCRIGPPESGAIPVALVPSKEPGRVPVELWRDHQ